MGSRSIPTVGRARRTASLGSPRRRYHSDTEIVQPQAMGLFCAIIVWRLRTSFHGCAQQGLVRVIIAAVIPVPLNGRLRINPAQCPVPRWFVAADHLIFIPRCHDRISVIGLGIRRHRFGPRLLISWDSMVWSRSVRSIGQRIIVGECWRTTIRLIVAPGNGEDRDSEDGGLPHIILRVTTVATWKPGRRICLYTSV